MKTVTDKIINILVENFGLNELDVRANKDLETLGVDSIITIESQLDLEREFGIKIPDGDIQSNFTVEDISEYIQNKA